MDGSLPSFEDRLAYIHSTHELEDQIVELAGHLNAGNYRFLALIAEFDRRKGWNCRATKDCAHWLNWKCGIDLGAAREKVRTARALEKLPQVSAAMERGEISYSKVRAITRVATPENEHYFLHIAQHGTAHHVETLVRAYRRATEAEELSREQQQRTNREVRYCWDVDGSLILKARLPADVGALVLKALEAAVPEAPDDVDRAELGPQARRRDGRDLRELPRARCRGDERRRASPSRRPRFRGNVASRRRRSLRDRRRPSRCRGNGPAPGLRCQRRRDRRGCEGRAAERRPQDPQHPACATACAQRARQGLPLPRLHAQEVHGRAPRQALGAWRRDEDVEPRDAVSLSSSQGA